MEAAPEQDKEESRDSDQVMARRCCVGEEACLQGSVALPSLPSLECGWVGAPCWPKTTSSPQAFGRGGAPPPPPPPGGWVPAGPRQREPGDTAVPPAVAREPVVSLRGWGGKGSEANMSRPS